jgi:hypothetical protein
LHAVKLTAGFQTYIHPPITLLFLLLQSALHLKPYFTDAYNNMASALVQKGLIPEAMDCYMQVWAATNCA